MLQVGGLNLFQPLRIQLQGSVLKLAEGDGGLAYVRLRVCRTIAVVVSPNHPLELPQLACIGHGRRVYR